MQVAFRVIADKRPVKGVYIPKGNIYVGDFTLKRLLTLEIWNCCNETTRLAGPKLSCD
jgi:hypothetical protein